MKIIFLTLAIYAYGVLGASTTEEYPSGHSRSPEHIIEDKCLSNSHSKYAFENLRKAEVDYRKCERIAMNHGAPHPVKEHDEFCRYLQENGYYSCMQNLADSTLPCLDKTEKFFPRMILKAYNTTIDTLCGLNGLQRTEYFFNKLKNNENCLRDAFWSIIVNGTCIQNLTAYKNIMELQVLDLNQHDYCIDMESFVNCATELAEETCNSNFSILKLYISDLFLSVCEKPQIFGRFVRF